jgi:heme-degrading monooxygenase HmoA
MQTETTTERLASTELPAIAAVVTHEVEDYDAWKLVYDAHAGARRGAGIFATHVNRAVDDPNRVTVYVGARNAEELKRFLSSPDLKETMHHGGVTSTPQIILVTPVEDYTVKERRLPAAIVRHTVADFEAWKKAFDQHAATRSAAGIVGHAVNCSIDDRNLVVVYVQAETLAQLQHFTASADLKDTMERAGVQGPPAIAFVEGQDWTP